MWIVEHNGGGWKEIHWNWICVCPMIFGVVNKIILIIDLVFTSATFSYCGGFVALSRIALILQLSAVSGMSVFDPNKIRMIRARWMANYVNRLARQKTTWSKWWICIALVQVYISNNRCDDDEWKFIWPDDFNHIFSIAIEVSNDIFALKICRSVAHCIRISEQKSANVWTGWRFSTWKIDDRNWNIVREGENGIFGRGDSYWSTVYSITTSFAYQTISSATNQT